LFQNSLSEKMEAQRSIQNIREVVMEDLKENKFEQAREDLKHYLASALASGSKDLEELRKIGWKIVRGYLKENYPSFANKKHAHQISDELISEEKFDWATFTALLIKDEEIRNETLKKIVKKCRNKADEIKQTENTKAFTLLQQAEEAAKFISNPEDRNELLSRIEVEKLRLDNNKIPYHQRELIRNKYNNKDFDIHA
jgi:hypothetical protein